ncbi:MAG: c-type cytochrome biogenesis protein CcmI [Sneathiella sp.]
MIWIILALLLAAVMVLLLYPLLKSETATISRAVEGMEVYKQQLLEMDADVARGALSAPEAETFKLEIQRRMLRLSKEKADDNNTAISKRPFLAIAVLLSVPFSSFALYSYLGSPDITSKPLASRNIAQEKDALAGQDLGVLVERLSEKLQESPDNLDGWVLLARTLSRMGRYEEAANTYLQATTIAENDADLYVGAGENFYFLANGVMTEAAVKAFEDAASKDPKHPGARYYLAIRDIQEGHDEKALQSLIALFKDSDAEAPFMQIVKGRIEELSSKTGTDVSTILTSKPVLAAPPLASGPTSSDVKAAQDMSEGDRQDMIRSMVERLANRMDENPEFDGLMRLGQVYGTLGEFEDSAEAYGRAASMDAQNPAPLSLQAFALIRTAEKGTPPPEAAIALYRKVLAIDGEVPEALWYVGAAEARSGNSAAALKSWVKLQSLVPEDSPLKTNVTQAINALSKAAQN